MLLKLIEELIKMRKRESKTNDTIITYDSANLELHFEDMESHFGTTVVWMTNNQKRSDRSAAVQNILSSSANYLGTLSRNITWHVSVMALCARNLYELNIRLRNISISQENLDSWNAESILDRVEMCDAFINIADAVGDTYSRKDLQHEKERLSALGEKYALPKLKRLASTAKMAKELGFQEEHKSMFKYFSKLIHPSSMLVNDLDKQNSDASRSLIIRAAQIYSWNTYRQTCSLYDVPKDVAKFTGRVLSDDA